MALHCDSLAHCVSFGNGFHVLPTWLERENFSAPHTHDTPFRPGRVDPFDVHVGWMSPAVWENEELNQLFRDHPLRYWEIRCQGCQFSDKI